jgi:hypothetical protein
MPRTVETDGGQVTNVGNTNTAAGTVDLGQSGGAGLAGNLNDSGIDQTNLGGVSFGNTPITTSKDFNPIVNTGATDFSGTNNSFGGTNDSFDNSGTNDSFGETTGSGEDNTYADNTGTGADNFYTGGNDSLYAGNTDTGAADKTTGGLDTLYSNVTNNAVDNITTNAGNPTINTNPAGTTGGLDTLYSNVTNTSAGGNAVDTTGNFDVYPDNTGLRDYGRMGAMGDMDMFAAGGMPMTNFNLGGYSDGGRLLKGPGDGVSDSIPATIGHSRQPARLADGEFVIPARIVSELGNGSTEAGARQLYAMMDRIQKARSKTVGKGRVAKDTRAEKYLPV